MKKHRSLTIRRPGWTLLEVALMSCVGTAVAGMATVLLTRYMGLNQAQLRQTHESQELRRLTRQVRDDAHAASGATSSEPAKLTLTLGPTRKVTYFAQDNFIERTLSEDEKDVARDSFDISPRGAVHWKTPPAGESGQIVITLEPAVADSGAPLPSAADQAPLEIVANLGTDHRAIEQEAK